MGLMARVGLVTATGMAISLACSASDGGSGGPGSGGSGGSSGSDASTGGVSGGDAALIDSPSSDGNLTFDSSCANFVAEAKQAPAALLTVIDRSSSMAGTKWNAAQLAIVQSIDADSFDNLSLGLLAYPSGDIPGPACVLGLPVGCGVSALPQVPLADTGTAKSNQPGVRQQIYNWLSVNQPTGTSTPGYDALGAAIQALQIYPLQGAQRIVLLISDGAFGCTSLSNRPGFIDSVGCNDWEYPDSVIKLLYDSYTAANNPVRTFVVGVPGSDTKPGDPEAPPYYMRRALSAFALAGSPDTVPAGCDGSYSQSGTDPAVPCHFDLTQGNFNAPALAKAISDIRGKALGCVYQLPTPTGGGTVDKGKVNVDLTLGGTKTPVLKRSDPTDNCAQDYCWDYDAQDNVVLIGKSCDDVSAATDAKVEIYVGCETLVK